MRKAKSTGSLYSLEIKNGKPFEKRFVEYKRLRNLYPNDVPMVVVLVKNNKPLSTHKILISKDTEGANLVATLVDVIDPEYNIDAALTTFERGGRTYRLKEELVLEDLYREYKENDGFMYLVCQIT